MFTSKMKKTLVLLGFGSLILICGWQEIRIAHLQKEMVARQELTGHPVPPLVADASLVRAETKDGENSKRVGAKEEVGVKKFAGDGVRSNVAPVESRSTELLQARGRISVLNRELAEEQERADNLQSNLMAVGSAAIQTKVKWSQMLSLLKINLDFAADELHVPDDVASLSADQGRHNPALEQYALYFQCKFAYQIATDFAREGENNEGAAK